MARLAQIVSAIAVWLVASVGWACEPIVTQSTTGCIAWIAVDDADLKTRETGLTGTQYDIYLRKHGATTFTLISPDPTIRHLGNGVYEADLSTSNTDTLGDLIADVRDTGGTRTTPDVSLKVYVAPRTLQAGLGNLDTATTSRMATYTQPTGFLAATFPTGTVANTTNITAASGVTVATNNDKTGYSLTQAFPANFALMAITAGGLVDLTQTAADKVWATTSAEPGQGSPPATTTLRVKLDYLYKAWRNKITQTSTTYSIFNDAGTVIDQKATTSDNGTTFERTGITTGP